MLKRFSVSNFLSFSEKITFDLSCGNYDFNATCVKNGIVNNCAIFGANGSGKTDIFIAMQNICHRINPKQIISTRLHTFNGAQFCYEFVINGNSLIYEYAFDSDGNLSSEILCINGNTKNHTYRNFSYDKSILVYLYETQYMIENEHIRITINDLYHFVSKMVFCCPSTFNVCLPDYKANLEKHASSGERVGLFLQDVIGYATNNDISFLFIDNFDAHLDIRSIRYFIEKLKEMEIQFIVVCSNTISISNEILRPDCYFVMQKNRIDSFQNLIDKELRFSHDIEKIYRSGAFFQ